MVMMLFKRKPKTHFSFWVKRMSCIKKIIKDMENVRYMYLGELFKSVLDFEVVIANKKNTHTKNKPYKNRKRD